MFAIVLQVGRYPDLRAGAGVSPDPGGLDFGKARQGLHRKQGRRRRFQPVSINEQAEEKNWPRRSAARSRDSWSTVSL